MTPAKKGIIIVLIVGIGLFGYSQYASASQIGVVITESKLLEENEKGSVHNVKLEFDNPSLLVLTAGETDFFVSIDEKTVADGKLQPFVLPPLSKTTVEGKFLSDHQTKSDKENPIVKISGVTKYDVFFTSIDVPFVYYPTEEQAREFIHEN